MCPSFPCLALPPVCPSCLWPGSVPPTALAYSVSPTFAYLKATNISHCASPFSLTLLRSLSSLSSTPSSYVIFSWVSPSPARLSCPSRREVIYLARGHPVSRATAPCRLVYYHFPSILPIIRCLISLLHLTSRLIPEEVGFHQLECPRMFLHAKNSASWATYLSPSDPVVSVRACAPPLL